MLLAIDIGNTNIVLGVFDNKKLKEKWRISTDEKKTEDEYASIISIFLHDYKLTCGIISSVVPNLNTTFNKMLNKLYNISPMMVTGSLKLNIKLKYPIPSEIGADRIVNAVSAVSMYEPPLILIDFGTATTFCYIDKNKNYCGGLILPGVLLMLETLHLKTARLPEVEIKKPAHLVGRSTVESIQSGVYCQSIGSINYIIQQLMAEYSNKSKIILTGGLADLFIEDIRPEPIIDRDLTLNGLNIIYQLNT